MGAHEAFLKLPEKSAAAEIARLVESKNFDALIGALKALQGDTEHQLHVALGEAYLAIHDRLEANASRLAREAVATSGTTTAMRARNASASCAREWRKVGKKDVLNELEQLRPDLWKYQNSKSPRWRTEMWKKADIPGLDQVRPG